MSTPEPPPYPTGDQPDQPTPNPAADLPSPPPPPSPYGQQPPPPPIPPTPHIPGNSKATTSLVTGIVGLLCCGLLGIVAVITGKQATAEAAAAGLPQPSNAKAGIILGWVSIGLMVLILAVYVILAVVGLAGSALSNSNY